MNVIKHTFYGTIVWSMLFSIGPQLLKNSEQSGLLYQLIYPQTSYWENKFQYSLSPDLVQYHVPIDFVAFHFLPYIIIHDGDHRAIMLLFGDGLLPSVLIVIAPVSHSVLHYSVFLLFFFSFFFRFFLAQTFFLPFTAPDSTLCANLSFILVWKRLLAAQHQLV